MNWIKNLWSSFAGRSSQVIGYGQDFLVAFLSLFVGLSSTLAKAYLDHVYWPLVRTGPGRWILLPFRISQWILYAVIDTAFMLISVLFFNWWVPLLARPAKRGTWHFKNSDSKWMHRDAQDYLVGEEVLPRWLSWFQTHDASLDAGWIAHYFTKPGQYTPDAPPSWWKRKLYQIRWLYRNPGYSFSYYVLGCPVQLDQWDYIKFKCVQDTPSKKGWWLFIAVSREGYFNLNLQGRWGSYKLGWKIWNYWSRFSKTWYSTVDPWGPEWRTQVVCSVNPVKRINIDLLA